MRILQHLRTEWFRYGFETLAVIVGILAAFALDNWNDHRKQNLLEIEYLEGIEADLVNDTAYYSRRIADSESLVENNRDAVRQMYQTQNNIEEVRSFFKNVGFNNEYLTTQNSTYLELTNSGNLSILSNRVLKDMIVDYYRENEMAAKHISEFNEVSSRHLIELGNVLGNMQRINLAFRDLYDSSFTVNETEWHFLNDPSSRKFLTLEYTIAVYRLKHIEFLEHFRQLKGLSTQLIEETQKELDTRKKQ